MPLSLNVLRYRESAPEPPLTATFDKEGGNIGRRPDNDWVLPDPERFISSRHANIRCRDGHYYIEDVSTNGVFINQAAEPVGYANSVELHDGDRLTIGDYEIEVSVTPESEPAEPTPAAFTDPFAAVVRPTPVEPEFEPAIPEVPAGQTEPQPPAFGFPEAEEPVEPELEPFPEIEVSPPAETDHVSELDEFFPTPQAIPEDWDLEGGVAPPPAETTAPEPIPPEPPFSDQLEEAAPLPPGHAIPTPGPPARPESPPAKQPPPPAVPGTPDQEQLLQALAEGLGLTTDSLRGEPLPELVGNLGRLLRASVQGAMELLRARADMKGEFRMSQTTIRPVENNPLKFMATVDEALTHLVTSSPGRGYLAPMPAVNEAYQDIEAHLLAVLAGMQAALRVVLQRFDPKALEQRLEQGAVLDRYLPLSRHAKRWELFTELYSEIAEEAEEDFHSLFGQAFAEAYEKQIRRLQALKRGDLPG